MVSRAEMMSWLAEFEAKFASRQWKGVADGLCMLGPCHDDDDDRDEWFEIRSAEWNNAIRASLRKLPADGLKAVRRYYRLDLKRHDTGAPNEYGLILGTICAEREYAVKVLDLLNDLEEVE